MDAPQRGAEEERKQFGDNSEEKFTHFTFVVELGS